MEPYGHFVKTCSCSFCCGLPLSTITVSKSHLAQLWELWMFETITESKWLFHAPRGTCFHVYRCQSTGLTQLTISVSKTFLPLQHLVPRGKLYSSNATSHLYWLNQGEHDSQHCLKTAAPTIDSFPGAPEALISVAKPHDFGIPKYWSQVCLYITVTV